jgi:hypothetical protein
MSAVTRIRKGKPVSFPVTLILRLSKTPHKRKTIRRKSA